MVGCGWMDEWTDGEKMDGRQVDGRTEGWMDGRWINLPEMLTFGFVLKSSAL